MAVEVGDEAPDFTLRNQFKDEVTLSDLRGKKNVVLIFYPFAFTGVCTGEMCAIRDERPEFENDTTAVFGISTDTVASLRIFADQEKLEFPLLSDFWPHGDVAKKYGVFNEALGAATRGTFIIDREGVVRYKVVNAIPDARNQDEYKKALAELS
ncbi:MAG: mycoredoxin-dependent peroxiredoxin [Frankiales bacterium]|jgi:peroxiredoxin|nr:mycoredoxin-dependent peroxiredoxin [Frankiales bacterium]